MRYVENMQRMQEWTELSQSYSTPDSASLEASLWISQMSIGLSLTR